MEEPFFDFLGNELNEGDTVVIAFPDGNSASFRVGKIIGVEFKQDPHRHIPSKKVPHLEIEWDKKRSSRGAPDKPTKIWHVKSRFLKLPE